MRNIALRTDGPEQLAEQKRIDEMRTAAAEVLRLLDASVASEQGRPLPPAVHDAMGPYGAIMDKAIVLGVGGDSVGATRMLLKDVRPLQTASPKAVDALPAHQERRMQQLAGVIQDGARDDGALMLGLALAAGLATGLGAWAITRSIVRPISAAVAVARTVAAGDLSAHMQVDNGDEAGEPMQAKKTMNEALTVLVTEVRHGSE